MAAITRKLVSLTDGADMLAVSTKTVRRYIADGHLDAVRLRRRTIRIKIDRSTGSSMPDLSADGGVPGEWVSRLASLAPQPPEGG